LFAFSALTLLVSSDVVKVKALTAKAKAWIFEAKAIGPLPSQGFKHTARAEIKIIQYI